MTIPVLEMYPASDVSIKTASHILKELKKIKAETVSQQLEILLKKASYDSYAILIAYAALRESSGSRPNLNRLPADWIYMLAQEKLDHYLKASQQ